MATSNPKRKPASREPGKPKAFLDATVLMAGIVWPRWSYEVLQHARRGDFELVLSPTVIESARRHIAAKFPIFTASFEQAISTELRFEMAADPSPQEITANLNLVRHDHDVPVALAAIRAGFSPTSGMFVSDDKDFTDEVPSTALVRSKLNIMRPVIFLREVMGWTSEESGRISKRNWSDLL